MIHVTHSGEAVIDLIDTLNRIANATESIARHLDVLAGTVTEEGISIIVSGVPGQPVDVVMVKPTE